MQVFLLLSPSHGATLQSFPSCYLATIFKFFVGGGEGWGVGTASQLVYEEVRKIYSSSKYTY